jgi:hypothetical protein
MVLFTGSELSILSDVKGNAQFVLLWDLALNIQVEVLILTAVLHLAVESA